MQAYVYFHPVEASPSPGAYAYLDPGIVAERLLQACMHTYMRFIDSNLELAGVSLSTAMLNMPLTTVLHRMDFATALAAMEIDDFNEIITLDPDRNIDC